MSCAGCADCSLTKMAGKYSPFEIHITVNEFTTDIDQFTKFCEEINIKSLWVKNYSGNSGDILKNDYMTRSTIRGSVVDAFAEMHRVSTALSEAGYDVVRNKIETVPWIYSELVDGYKSGDIPYFENHLEISNPENIQDALSVAKKYGAYVSQNARKPDILMMTFRLSHVDNEEFTAYAKRMMINVGMAGLVINKTVTELAFYDDNLEYDSAWINGESIEN